MISELPWERFTQQECILAHGVCTCWIYGHLLWDGLVVVVTVYYPIRLIGLLPPLHSGFPNTTRRE